MHKIKRILEHNYQLSSYMLAYSFAIDSDRDSPFTALKEIPFSYPRVGPRYTAKKAIAASGLYDFAEIWYW